MKRRDFLQTLVLCLFGAGCGQFGESSTEDFSGGGNPAPTPVSEVLRLISAVELPDKRWEYHLAVDMAAVSGDKSAPFLRYKLVQQNWWLPDQIGSINNGWMEFLVTTFDAKLLLLYGGNQTLQNFAVITDSMYYVPKQPDNNGDALGLGLENGKLLKWAEFTEGHFGGPITDPARVIELSLQGDQLTIYFNLGFVPGSVSDPFWFSNRTDWKPESIIAPSSKGWGSIALTIADGERIQFTFGGDRSTMSWATVNQSAYFSPTAGPFGALVAKRQGSAMIHVP